MQATADPVVRRFIAVTYPRLRDEWRAEHVLLYGSRVCGGSDEWSDLDVIVVSAAFDRMTFVDRPGTVWEAVGCPAKVEMLCYTPDEFERKRREPGVVATACREGIWLGAEPLD